MSAPIFREPIVYFDVDDTLVSWNHYGQFIEGMIEFTAPESEHPMWLEPIKEHIEALKAHKLRGHTVIVWSAGGALWAKEVALKLGLTKYVDAYMSKPNWFYDDIPAKEFMPEINRKHYILKGKSEIEDE
jgi:phosphoserine phosphatase